MTYLEPLLAFALCSLFFAFWRCRRMAGNPKPCRWFLGCALGLFLASWPPATWLLAQTLEGWYPVVAQPPKQSDAAAIVVLAGSMGPSEQGSSEPVLSGDTFARCSQAARLWKTWRQAPLVVAGGRTDASAAAPPIAAVMARELIYRGVAPESILIEDTSTSTYENARRIAELLRPRGINHIVLVTDAYHTLRADLCFRRQGFLVTPIPCSWRRVPFQGRTAEYFPSARSLSENDEHLHEWLGLLWYKLKGRI